MDLVRASTYMFADKRWLYKFGLIVLVSPIPIFGQLWALGFVNHCLQRIVKGNAELPDVKLNWQLAWQGIRVFMVMAICTLVIGLLSAPLFIGQDATEATYAPAMIQAFQGPSALLVTIVAAVVTGVALLRFAMTNSFMAAFHLPTLWKQVRAEPAIWICFTLVGFVLTEGPYALVWILPLQGSWDVLATMLSTSIFWVIGLMINAHLVAQAYTWSQRTASSRATEVRYRW
jgi:hypothetical protein